MSKNFILLSDLGHQKSYLVVLQAGDKVMESLEAFINAEGINAGHFTAIGALKEVTLAWYDLETKSYIHIPVPEQVEVTGAHGNIALKEDNSRMIHLHMNTSFRSGDARLGHVLEGTVDPTFEVYLTAYPKQIRRVLDEASGLPLINIAATEKANS